MIIKKIILIMAMSGMVSNAKAIDPLELILGVGCLGGAVFTVHELWKAAEVAIEGNALIGINPGWDVFGWSPKVPVTVSLYGKHLQDLLKRNETPEVDDVLRYVRIRYGAAIGWGLGTCGLLLVGLTLLKKKSKE